MHGYCSEELLKLSLSILSLVNEQKKRIFSINPPQKINIKKIDLSKDLKMNYLSFYSVFYRLYLFSLLLIIFYSLQFFQILRTKYEKNGNGD